jgi:hypothetical protein
MTRKERPKFNEDFNEAEFFGFARSYLSEALPNPQRMAEHPVEERNAEVSEHLTYCSPCFNRYMQILVDVKRNA